MQCLIVDILLIKIKLIFSYLNVSERVKDFPQAVPISYLPTTKRKSCISLQYNYIGSEVDIWVKGNREEIGWPMADNELKRRLSSSNVYNIIIHWRIVFLEIVQISWGRLIIQINYSVRNGVMRWNVMCILWHVFLTWQISENDCILYAWWDAYTPIPHFHSEYKYIYGD